MTTVTMNAPTSQGMVQSEYGNYPINNGKVTVDARLLTALTNAGYWLDPNTSLQSQVTALQAAMPSPAVAVPSSEKTGGALGLATLLYALADHQHPRLTSVTWGTLVTNGLSGNLMFTRTFTVKPGVVLTPVEPGGTQPVMLWVDSWIQDGSLNYTGCVVKGFRLRLLPTTLTLLNALQSYDVAAGSADGITFSMGAIQIS